MDHLFAHSPRADRCHSGSGTATTYFLIEAKDLRTTEESVGMAKIKNKYPDIIECSYESTFAHHGIFYDFQ